jgi:hypothetical protein
LLIFKGIFDGVCVEISLAISLEELVLVDDWILFGEIFLIFLVQEVLHRFRVTRENRAEVRVAELQKSLVKESWVRLLFDQVEDVSGRTADVEALEDKELS